MTQQEQEAALARDPDSPGAGDQAGGAGRDEVGVQAAAGITYFRANTDGTDGSPTGGNAITVGPNGIASGRNNLAIGNGAQATGGYDAMAMGWDARATAQSTIAFGAGARATGNRAFAIGESANASALQAIAFGAGSKARGELSVALGHGSVAEADGTVSVGTSEFKRTIVNVAPGEVSESSTDAINGSQLYAALGGGGGSVGDLQYFHANSSKPDGEATGSDAIAVGPLADAPGSGGLALGLEAVANGQNSTALGSNAASVADWAQAIGSRSVAIGAGDVAVGVNTQANGDGTAALAVGTGANAGGAGAVAIGHQASVSAADSVAIGNGSVALREGTVSVGTLLKPRRIVHVMRGELDSDAATVGQLKDAGLNLNAAGEVSNAFVAYDDATLGRVTLANTLVTSLVPGELTEGSQDAVTGAQLFATNQQLGQALDALSQINTAVEDITGGDAGVKYFHVDSTASDADASGTNALAIGPNASAKSTGAVAVGDATAVTGAGGLALGAGASVSGSYSVALGQGSVADRPNTVSVGAADARRRIVNVEAGVADNDAVTVGQLRTAGLDVNASGNVGNAFLAYDDDSKARATLDNTLVTGLRAASLTQLSTDAVTGGQLFQTNAKVTKNAQDIADLAETVAGISSGDADLKYLQVKSTGAGATASGNNAIAIGPLAVKRQYVIS